MPRKAKKRRRLGVSTTAADRLKAEHPNHVWALDFQHDATDDGRKLTAAVLREWCQRGSTDTAYIEPGSSWQNPYVESFNARMRDELLNVELFTCLEEAQVLAADWRSDYNANHPHSALDMMSP